MEGGKAGACLWVMNNTLRTIFSIIIRVSNLTGAALSGKSLFHRREVGGHTGYPVWGAGLEAHSMCGCKGTQEGDPGGRDWGAEMRRWEFKVVLSKFFGKASSEGSHRLGNGAHLVSRRYGGRNFPKKLGQVRVEEWASENMLGYERADVIAVRAGIQGHRVGIEGHVVMHVVWRRVHISLQRVRMMYIPRSVMGMENGPWRRASRHFTRSSHNVGTEGPRAGGLQHFCCVVSQGTCDRDRLGVDCRGLVPPVKT